MASPYASHILTLYLDCPKIVAPSYLSPIVLEKLVAHRRPCSLSIKDLIAAAERPWFEQESLVFDS